MALRRQSLSPAAALLRSSRLFSLPNPLPPPPVGDVQGGNIIKASDTATLPYPTHQAIITTPASLARGDWGLKRPLPNKSSLLKVSDPVLKISQLDTIEHVTDYDSAADHVRTREKWEAMGVPMMKGLSAILQDVLSGADPWGAFELRDDTTSYDTDLGLDEKTLSLKALRQNYKINESRSRKTNIKQKEVHRAMRKIANGGTLGASDARAKRILEGEEKLEPVLFSPFIPPPVNFEAHNTKRWKYDGPWLPGMSADEFVVYLNKEVSRRRSEFQHYLLQWVKSEIYKSRKQATSNSTEKPLEADEAAIWQSVQEKQWSTFNKQDIDTAVSALRREAFNNILSSRLVKELIFPFLRLPNIDFKNKLFHADANGRDVDQFRISDDTEPLSTHPSAGLGYLRTKSYLSTHPILGPQAHPAPIPARVVQPRTTSSAKEARARLGVGGFVADDELLSTDYKSAARANISNAQDVEFIDIDTVGGKKVFVHPMFGSVTNNGQIMIKLKRATGQEDMVARGLLDDKPVWDVESKEEGMEGSGGDGENSERAIDLARVLATQMGQQGQQQQQQQTPMSS